MSTNSSTRSNAPSGSPTLKPQPHTILAGLFGGILGIPHALAAVLLRDEKVLFKLSVMRDMPRSASERLRSLVQRMSYKAPLQIQSFQPLNTRKYKAPLPIQSFQPLNTRNFQLDLEG